MAVLDLNRDRLVDVRVGDLRLRLAETEAEVEAAQSLRYRIFYESMAARPTPEMAAARRDFDSFDEYCDHLLVFDTRRGDGPEAVIGTYRVMRRPAAAERGQFYSADEFDISNLLAYPGEILELGRSCIDAAYRTGTTMQLLWRGIAEYGLVHRIELMFGCASLPGIDPDRLAVPLTYLYHHHLAPPALRPWAIPERYVAMNRMPPESIVPRRALQTLPPLIKGYLRLGAYVAGEPAWDPDFNCADLFILMPVSRMNARYAKHFLRKAT
jgi:putative hemolysin